MRRLLASATPFSYTCAGCGRCCHNQRITLSPYETMRLAAARGTTTTEILTSHTSESGTVLRFPDGGCTFLVDGQCSVHAARPLACRLYPVGRHVQPDGGEAFVELTPHPETEGTYGEDGTVGAWVTAQGGDAFIASAAKTYALLARLLELVDQESIGEALGTSDAVASDWLDVDAIVSRAAADRGASVPSDLEEKYQLYLEALEGWIEAHHSARK